MKIYRGMSASDYVSRYGLTRRGERADGEQYTGGLDPEGRDPKEVAKYDISAGDPNLFTAPCLANSLYLHSVHSEFHPQALLSFSTAFDVAAYFSYVRNRDRDAFGIVVETDSSSLNNAGFSTNSNMGLHGWEREVSVLVAHVATLPDSLIAKVHKVHLGGLHASALALHLEHEGSPGVPQFLKNVDHPFCQ